MANSTPPLAPSSLKPANPDLQLPRRPWPALDLGQQNPQLLRSPLLALDLGQQTGWALRQASGRITSGCHGFKPGRFEGGGMPLLRFAAWLEELHRGTGPLARVYFEEVRAHKGTAAAHTYGAFLGQLTAWCEHHHSLPGRSGRDDQETRNGQGQCGQGGHVIAAMRAQGFHPADDNEADALALLEWAIAGVRHERLSYRAVGHPTDEPGAGSIKRHGWREQGILVISPEDRRLDWLERQLLTTDRGTPVRASGVAHD